MTIKHKPLDAMEYPRFEGIRTFTRLPHITDLQDVDFLIAGVPFDTGGTFRVGGDHSISLPLLRAAKKQFGPLALVHFDAHNDLWHGYFNKKDTHGTPFRRAIEEKLIDPSLSCQIGLRGPLYNKNDSTMSEDEGLLAITGPELHQIGIDRAIKLVKKRVGNGPAYLTFDIDFLDPAYAPGTGTPEAGGFTGYESIRFIRGLKNIDFIGFDLVEVMPGYDPTQMTCLLAANIIYEFISLIALQKKAGQ